MTTRSLLDALRSGAVLSLQLQTTLQEAQSAVARDDHLSLRPLLALPNGEGRGTIREVDFVNPSVEENLLHFAVRQLAGFCVHMLVNAPYKWDPQRRNVLGSTPLDLALGKQNAYLPVVWPLVMASSDVFKDFSANPTLTSLLLRPPTTPLSQSLIVKLCRKNFVDVDFTTSTIILLFELIHCTPNLLVASWNTPEAQRCPECLAIGDTEEAICLKDQNRIFDFPVRYACWLWHRYRATCDVPGQLSPSSLLTCCRVVIRRTIMKNLSISGSVMDYAKALQSLNVPSWMLAFLAFREMWPIVNPKHKFQFRQRQRETPATEHLLQSAYDVYDLVV
ncbi:hypothetical transcript [Echinococcus multilocularis]|uniref:Hypothetical transcript n=1 Tax=Echinococcus multilocularis TaxID=6211 RepID=A0A068XWN2_ECHMU|nr:hypothetical transcript [Echinococcus multilocularis]